MDRPKRQVLPEFHSCSVCLEVVTDASERSTAKLICGHVFHLDCIGSAFNAKGCMQCPNCRRIEHGQWLYANGSRQREEDVTSDGQIVPLSDIRDIPIFIESLASPIQGHSSEGFNSVSSLENGLVDDQHAVIVDPVSDFMVVETLEDAEPVDFCLGSYSPRPALVAYVSGAEDSMRVQESGAHPQRTRNPMQLPSSSRHLGVQHPVALALVDFSHEESWSPHLENPSTVQNASPQTRYHGRRQPITYAQYVDNQPGSLISSRSSHYLGQSALPNLHGESELRNNAPFSQTRDEVASVIQLLDCPEREGSRWPPYPFSGSWGMY